MARDDHAVSLDRLNALQEENTALRKKVDRYEKMALRFRKLVETMREGLLVLDGEGRLTYVNKHLEEISGYATEELVGHPVHEFLPPEAARLIYSKLSGEHPQPRRPFEIAWQRKDGETRHSIVSPQILDEARTGLGGGFAVVTDITAKKKSEHALRRRERELQAKNVRLEEMNLALQTLVKMRANDKDEIESALSMKLQQLVEPLVEKLHSSGLNERQRMILTQLSANLAEISTSCHERIPSQFLVLTPAEMDVANLVKHGRTTKEIAALMNISARTVDMHRLNIRRKFGIYGRGTNLRSFLLSAYSHP